MVQELLLRILSLKQHIALLLLLLVSGSTVYSQSVLLPGDVVIVSVNSSGDSFDFIPLVKLEEGTSVWFSNGEWNTDSLTIGQGQEVEVIIKASIDAGTNIHINEIEDPRVEVKGYLDFGGEGDRIFAYQKDEGIARVIYGIGWGHPDIWNENSLIGSAVPSSISKENNSLVQLGSHQNYQYYLRNGASGTQSMLASFVGSPAHWRGRDDQAFNSLGTAFRLLKPPVVHFDESISTVREGESIILNVAIFEHDGSRLTVDAVFNEFNSSADSNDVSKFKKRTFNFTGLIGDAVYAVEVPTLDDRVYESTENAFFELQNLSKGELGDFVTHVAFLPDNEIPKVQVNRLAYSGTPESDFIEIQNNERIDVDISGWQLHSNGILFEFPYGTHIQPLQKFTISHPEFNNDGTKATTWLKRNQGQVQLKNEMEQLVSALEYRINNTREDRISSQEITNREILSGETPIASQISAAENTSALEKTKENQKKLAGWYIAEEDQRYDFGSDQKDFFVWNELSASFLKVDQTSEFDVEPEVLLAYYTEDELMEEVESQVVDSTQIVFEDELIVSDAQEWTVILSGTDLDENGLINGSEGFTLLRNPSNNEITVRDFIEQVETSLFEGALYPNIYLWDDRGQGWMSSKVLAQNDRIPANSTFWVRADSAFESAEIIIQSIPYQESDPLAEEVREPEFELSFVLESSDLSKPLSIRFLEESDHLIRDIIAPEMERSLRVSGDKFLFFAAEYGLNWNSEINLSSTLDQRVMIPLAFETSESGAFKLLVQKFDGIPSDWNIALIDEESRKEHELNANWQLEFEYFRYEETESDATPELGGVESEDTETKHQFMLMISPPGTEGSQRLIPEEISLHQNYPNPFNPSTTISFYLPESMPVKLSVFNVVGQPVAVLSEGTLGPGDHEFEWNASGLPSGMYIYQLEVGNKVMTRKMTLVK